MPIVHANVHKTQARKIIKKYKCMIKHKNKVKVKKMSDESVQLSQQVEMDKLSDYIKKLQEYISTLIEKNKELETRLELINSTKNDIPTMDVEHNDSSDNQDFPELVKKRKKKTRKTESKNNIAAPAESDNSVKLTPQTIVNEANKKTNIEIVADKPNKDSQKKEKIPPIVAYNINAKEVIDKLNTAVGKEHFSLRKINRNVTHIITSTINSFINAMNIIKQGKTNYYTYTPKELKQTTVLMKGVDSSYDEDDIKSAFNDLQVSQHISKITKYQTRKSINDRRDLNIWLLQLNPNTDMSVFKDIKYLLHQTVTFERFVRTESIQCKNCQRYGHAASNCNMPYRCVKCIENHAPGECQKQDRTNEPFCINCNKLGHPANYRQCPKYQELQERKDKLRQQQQEQQIAKQQMYNRYYNPGVSYSRTVAPRAQYSSQSTQDNSRPTVPNTNASSWDQTCTGMFGLNFTDTLRQFYDFTPKFNAIQDPIVKKITLFEFFAKLTNPQ